MIVKTVFNMVMVIGLNGLLLLGCVDSDSSNNDSDTSTAQSINDDTDSGNKLETNPNDTESRNTYRHKFESTLEISPASITEFEIITPGVDNITETKPSDFYLIETEAELEAFQADFFQVDFAISDNYFDAGIILIHTKATYGGPIENLAVSVANNEVVIEYNWEDGGADCYCYRLVAVYISLESGS